MSNAKELVKVCDDIANEIGIPIVNKRISVTPVSIITARTGNALKVAKLLTLAQKKSESISWEDIPHLCKRE